MKQLKIIVLIAGLLGMIFLSVSCIGSSGAATVAKPTIATVQRGNLTIAVTGTGNLALEYKTELSFGETGLVTQESNAKISDVLVNPGDTVQQGQILVKADTTDWQDQLTQDQHQLDTAKANLLTAQNDLATDQMKLIQQADVQNIQTELDTANTQLQTAQTMLQQDMTSPDPYAVSEVQYWNQAIKQYQANVATYQKQMSDLLSDPVHYLASTVNGSAASAAEIKNLQLQIQQDQDTITLRQNAADDAQTTLNDDQTLPQEITAPFNGLITQVNVNQGDIVQRNANLIEITQPDKFIANILVTERDVMSVKVGGDATVSFDALSGLNFPAKITQIAPLATVQQGVVNYAVTVELTSTQPVFPGRTGTAGQVQPQSVNSGTSASVDTSGAIPNTSPLPTGTPRTTTGGNPPAGVVQSITLKDGLSATVNIVVQEKDNVLMVSSRAITRQGRNSMVQKVAGTGTEQTTVQTGITDGNNTEIVSGLSEGDQVSIQPRPTSTTTTNQGRPPGIGGIRLP